MTDQERDAMLITILANQATFGIELAENTRATAKIGTGFPGGDMDGHRRYHEGVIEWQELRNKLVREALIKVAQAGALAGAGWVLIAIWQALKLTIKQ